MSQVKVKDRKQNDFQVILKAKELSVYTCKIISNKNVFNLSQQGELSDEQPQLSYNPKLNLLSRIDEVATDIFLNAWKANNVRVTNTSSYNRRSKYQHYAADGCVELLALIEKSKNVFHLRYKKYSYWSKLTQEVKKLLSGWISSDATRYKEYRK